MDYTLLADGPSDIVLMGPLNWLFQRHGLPMVNGRFADPLLLPRPSDGLPTRIEAACREFPCDVLFVHRDAEGTPHAARKQEVLSAMTNVRGAVRSIPVIPVRMTEAWFLFDEAAIRLAADNPNGTMSLPLPTWRQWEREVSAKERLSQVLRTASGLQGRRLNRFDRSLGQRRRRVADYITDYTPLLRLPAFIELDSDIQELARILGR